MVEERRFLSATTFSAMDPSCQMHWGPNRERQTGERIRQGEEKTSVWESKQANSERRTAGSRGAQWPVHPGKWEGSRGKKQRKAGVTKSWERREKSELDMGLCVAPWWFLLLICLSQAELTAAEQEGKNSSRHKQVLQMHSVHECVLSYKQTAKCATWPGYLPPTSECSCMCKCACQSPGSHEISFLTMLVQALCVQSQICGVTLLEKQHFRRQDRSEVCRYISPHLGLKQKEPANDVFYASPRSRSERCWSRLFPAHLMCDRACMYFCSP